VPFLRLTLITTTRIGGGVSAASPIILQYASSFINFWGRRQVTLGSRRGRIVAIKKKLVGLWWRSRRVEAVVFSLGVSLDLMVDLMVADKTVGADSMDLSGEVDTVV
jgi:hypothetical protein